MDRSCVRTACIGSRWNDLYCGCKCRRYLTGFKERYIVGATPRNQQIALFIGAIVSSIVIGITIKYLDKPTNDMLRREFTMPSVQKNILPHRQL
jgi:hypothetical protein